MTQQDYPPDFRALCAELLQPLAESVNADPHHAYLDLVTRARAALAQPEPQGATDDEIEEWVDASWVVSLQEQCPDGDGWLISLTPEEFCNAIREALTRWGS